MIRSLLVPVAAFAVTATSVSAYNNDWFTKLDLDLTDDQLSALEQADEIRREANDEARAILEDAGIDNEKMREIGSAFRAQSRAHMDVVREAIEANDYDAYRTAVYDTPMADVIDTEEAFATLVKAYELRESGDYAAARELMDGLHPTTGGFMWGNQTHGMGMMGDHRGEGRPGFTMNSDSE